MSSRSGDRLGVAIVGAGLMGRWHAHAARRAGAAIVGIVDPDPVRCAELARRAGCGSFASLDELLKRTAPDALHVCAPTGSHREILTRAIEHGLHVFVEKPLAEDAPSTEAAFVSAAAQGLQLCPVHQYARQRSVGAVTRRLGELGGIVEVELRFLSAGGDGLQAEALPSLAADILPHPVSVMQRLFASAAVETLGWRIEEHADRSWQLTARHGTTGLRIVIGLAARPACATLSLSGRTGTFHADLFHDFMVFRRWKPTRKSKMLEPFDTSLRVLAAASANLVRRAMRAEPAYPGLVTLTREFYAACGGAGDPPFTAAETVGVARLRDRFLAEVSTGGRA